MATNDQLISVTFPEWYDELAEFEHAHKGYLNGVIAKVATGEQYDLNFIDPSRLQQSLDDNFSRGLNFFVERNLVVIRSVTRDDILAAVRAFCNEGLWRNTFTARPSE